MGLTIHFGGRLKSKSDFDQVLIKGRQFAKRTAAEILESNSEERFLVRIVDGQVLQYEGLVSGIRFQPHAKAEPIVLEFDQELAFQQFYKTQFAGISTHIEVVNFLREIEPHFEYLRVYDEGEFWTTNSVERLEEKFHDFNVAIELISRALESGGTKPDSRNDSMIG
jgi:hypothetical protein